MSAAAVKTTFEFFHSIYVVILRYSLPTRPWVRGAAGGSKSTLRGCTISCQIRSGTGTETREQLRLPARERREREAAILGRERNERGDGGMQGVKSECMG